MVGREEQRAKAVERLSAHVLATGLSQTSLRQLASAAGVSDRMLLYYFSDKNDVLVTVLGSLSSDLAQRLASAFPETQIMPVSELAVRLTQELLSDNHRPYIRLGVEIMSAAARKEQPFMLLSEGIRATFIQWIVTRMDAPEGSDREAVAAILLGLIDGLVLIGACVEDDLVERAIETIPALVGR